MHKFSRRASRSHWPRRPPPWPTPPADGAALGRNSARCAPATRRACGRWRQRVQNAESAAAPRTTDAVRRANPPPPLAPPARPHRSPRPLDRVAPPAPHRAAAAGAAVAAAPPRPPPAPDGDANGFNPAISLILSGSTRTPRRTRPTTASRGFALPPDAEIGPGTRGFSLGETELGFSASIDPWFRGAANICAVDAGQRGRGRRGLRADHRAGPAASRSRPAASSPASAT